MPDGRYRAETVVCGRCEVRHSAAYRCPRCKSSRDAAHTEVTIVEVPQ